MARLGMDVDAVGQAGKDLARQAAQINAAIGRIDGLIAQAGSAWQGVGAQGYVNEWRTTHRPKMRQTAQACADLAKVIARNVADQRATSSSLGGSATVRTQYSAVSSRSSSLNISGLRESVDAVDAFLNRTTLAHGAAAFSFATAIGTTWKGTKYGPIYRHLIKRGGFFNYNRSLYPYYNRTLTKIAKSSATTHVGTASKVFDVTRHGANLHKIFFDQTTRTQATNADRIEAVGLATGSALKASKNPVVYLAGAATSAATISIAEGSKTDWSWNSFKNTVNFAKNNGGFVVEEVAKATKYVLVDRVADIFG